MNTLLEQNTQSQNMIESIAIKMILHKIPEATKFLKLIKFVHEGDKAALDLELLPKETALQIQQLFA